MFSIRFSKSLKLNKKLGILPPLAPPEDWGGIRAFAISLLLTTLSFAQSFPPDSVWTFAYDAGGDEYFYDAIEVNDGYLLCGEAREWNALAGHGLIVKIDHAGQLVWQRHYLHSQDERFKSIIPRENGFWVGCERVEANGESNRLRVYELSSFGDVNVTFWHELGQDEPYRVRLGNMHSIGTMHFTTSYSLDLFPGERMFVLETSDVTGNSQMRYFGAGAINQNAGHIVLDETTFESLLYGTSRASIAEDSDGLLEYDNLNSATVGGDGDDGFFAAVQASSGNQVVFTGYTELSETGKDLWVVGTVLRDADSVLWMSHYGGLSYEDGVEIVNAADSGFIVAGNFSSEDIEFEQSDFWLLKVDSNGDSVWSVVKGGEEADRCEGMIKTENGFLLFGESQSYAVPGWDGCAMLLAYVPDLAPAPGALNFGVVGVSDSATRTLGLINTGTNVLTVTEISGTENYSAEFSGPQTVEIGDTLRVNVVFAPQSPGNHIDTLRIFSDAVSGTKIVRCLGAGMAAAADDESLLPTTFSLHPPYPNPFNPATTISIDVPRQADVELTIFDVQGRVVETLFDGELSAGTHSLVWSCGTCAGGVYFARLRTSEFVGIQKLVLLK